MACALAPAFVVRAALGSGFFNIVQLLGMAIGGLLLLFFARRPTTTLRLLVIVLPLQLLITSGLYRLGLNEGSVRLLGLWKELGVVGLVAAAGVAMAASPRALDPLDRLCLAYVVLGSLYFAVPQLVSAAGGTVSFDQRFISWRVTVLPVLILFAARHLRLDSAAFGRVMRTVLRLGPILATMALVELVVSGLWNALLVKALQVNRFRIEVLDVPAAAFTRGLDEIRTFTSIGGHQIIRVGGPLADPLSFAFLLLIVFAFLVERVVRTQVRWQLVLSTGLVGLGILMTQTRSAIVGAGVVAIAAMQPVAGRSDRGRVRFAVLVAAVAIAAVPLLLSSGAADRFVVGDTSSDQAHATSSNTAADTLREHPLGQGLGMGATGANRGVAGAVVAENQFLDVALQLGVLGALGFVLVVAVLIRQLGRAAARAPTGEVQLGGFAARSALLGLLVPCWYLQPFSAPEVGWLLFALAGAALGAAERAQHDDHLRSGGMIAQVGRA